MSTPIRTTTTVFALDCPNARVLAMFYADLLGWNISSSPESPDWVEVVPPSGEAPNMKLACQQIEGYRAPTWPEGLIPQQAHLDFHVDSVQKATPTVLAAGATRHTHQPSEDGQFVVFLDPVGHPFCLCEA
ncbi:VOC family protein [Gordonia sp. MP11Mi]|uniref:Glyoxalase-like domain-containing protein n=1 Tax=Gordonia sp. MP11Mi TaxID=3022769 RepID=A0AA97CSA4_9ACTN